jgi:outer membrane protein OmpA-like peptidoglycan-associated protein
MPKLLLWMLVLALLPVLVSCASPPKPPTVDESKKRPANSAMAVELQVCTSELHNTRIIAAESDRAARTAEATLEREAVRHKHIAAVAAAQAASANEASPAQAPAQTPAKAPAPPPANGVFVVHFEFGSTQLSLPAALAAALIEEARDAPLIMVRGRTDGPTDNAAESRIASGRAAAVRDYLVAAGIEPDRIRATYQPAGDPLADNTTAAGRSLNRRVEIEVYRALPVAMGSQLTAAH